MKHTTNEATDVEAEGTTAIASEKAKHTTTEATDVEATRTTNAATDVEAESTTAVAAECMSYAKDHND